MVSVQRSAASTVQRRTSQRSVKRRKFDDEIVESSLVKSERGRLKAPSTPVPIGSVPPTPNTSTATPQPPQPPVEKLGKPASGKPIEPVIKSEPHPPAPPPEKKKVISQKPAPKVNKVIERYQHGKQEVSVVRSVNKVNLRCQQGK